MNPVFYINSTLRYIQTIKKPQNYLISCVLISAFRKKVQLGHTTQEKIKDVFSLFRNHRKSNLYKQITITTKQFQAAETIIETTKNPLRSLDAIHLGIASSKEFNIPTIEI